jgi:hypothetical protein
VLLLPLLLLLLLPPLLLLLLPHLLSLLLPLLLPLLLLPCCCCPHPGLLRPCYCLQLAQMLLQLLLLFAAPLSTGTTASWPAV